MKVTLFLSLWLRRFIFITSSYPFNLKRRYKLCDYYNFYLSVSNLKVCLWNIDNILINSHVISKKYIFGGNLNFLDETRCLHWDIITTNIRFNTISNNISIGILKISQLVLKKLVKIAANVNFPDKTRSSISNLFSIFLENNLLAAILNFLDK